MKKSEQTPFQPPAEYGRSLTGFMLNILVQDMDKAVEFHQQVLGVETIYSDPDITIVAWQGQQWMIHADHTYDKHPLYGRIQGVSLRGIGAEFRLHGRNPDEAAAIARSLGYEILDAPRDQPDHGLRETHIVDADGYVWVPDVPLE
jgi:catechol 2,3-dioxygenase-like lactoylglutathione lyase family enzyme